MLLSPTQEVSDAFIHAYNHFNTDLFNSKLPPCLIHMHRKSKCYGYFAGDRFGNHAGDKVDEIALNPVHFKNRTVEQSLSTLVHEMVHLWQHRHGEHKPKGAYHNKEWAGHMEDKGLMPSTTGEAGGKKTGQKVTHYIIEGGDFANSCADLVASGFTLPYMDIWGDNSKTKAAKAASKTKYTCPDCGLNAWAKENVTLHCGDCSVALQSA